MRRRLRATTGNRSRAGPRSGLGAGIHDATSSFITGSSAKLQAGGHSAGRAFCYHRRQRSYDA